MLRHKSIDRICCIILACTLLLTCVYMGAAAGGLLDGAKAMGYEMRLFDQSKVHTIDIVIDDWEGFLETCTDEQYVSCSVVIDGEAYANVGIRAKGNTSLSSVASYGNDRYSFKLEFDQYQSGRTYYGLDKISLNNLIQDKTLMKDYLAYTLMNKMGVAAPLCSFVQINVNGEAWGLYLAVEAVEDGFLQRNYGSDHGELYKPDSLSMGGGRGNGRDFDMDAFSEQFAEQIEQFSEMDESERASFFSQFSERENFDRSASGASDGADADRLPSSLPSAPSDSSTALPSAAADSSKAEGTSRTDAASERTGKSNRGSSVGGNNASSESSDSAETQRFFTRGNMGGGMSMGSSDVKLQYIDDDPQSYSNIFSSAKTDVTEADQTRLIESLKKLSTGEDIESAVDAEAVIRYLVVHNFMCNDDSYTGNMIHNYYLYEKDGQLSMLPWDYNLAFGGFNMGGMGSSGGATSVVNSPIDSPVSSGDISDRPIIAWIFESEEYTALYHEIYAEFISFVYDDGWLDAEIARVSEMIAPYVQKDPTAFFTYEQFTAAIETLREFCSVRCASIAGQLEGVVPSTDEAQRTASASLIDASHIDLSDLGEFSMGGGKGGMEMFNGFTRSDGASTTMPDGITAPDGMTAPDGTTMPDDMTAPDGTTMPDDMTAPDGMTMPDDMTAPDDMTMPDDMTAPDGMTMPDDMTAPDAYTSSRASDVQHGMPQLSFERGAAASPNASGINSSIYLLVCTLLLAAAIAAAYFMKSGR